MGIGYSQFNLILHYNQSDILPAVERGDEDEGEYEEEDGGDDHHDERDLRLGQVLIDLGRVDSELFGFGLLNLIVRLD